MGGSEPAFVQQMNARAAELGMEHTTFRNACGLDTEGHLSTARDVAIMSRTILTTCPEVLHYTGIWTDTLRGGATQLVNTNKLLHRYNGITGLKTGTTDDAGYCFASAYNRDGDEIYTVVLNSSTTDQRFADTATLASWYYDHKVTVEIANTQKKTANGNPLMARVSQTDWTDKTIDATLADPTAQATVFSLAGEVTEKVSYDDLSGTVHVGDKVGSVTLKQDGTKIAVMDLVADEEGTGPNPIEWLLVKLDRLGRRIDNRPLTAESETVAKAPEV